MAEKPKRIQRKRTKGWKMPENTVYVGRPSKWGNPFTKDDNPLGNTNFGLIDHDCGETWQENTVYVGRPSKWGNPFTKDDNPFANTDYGLIEHDCGESWRAQVVFCFAWWFGYLSDEEKSDLLEPLRGKDLACWCPLDQPCHADILLELANS